jgi:uncharacterized membrane protein YfcA
MTVAVALVVLFAGLATGATSIGGILVVPALTSVGAVPVREAIAAANFSFAFTGMAAIALQRAAPPSSGAVPPWTLYGAVLAGAMAGAITLPWLPLALSRSAVAVLAVLSGAMSLRAAPAGMAAGARQQVPAPVLTGLVVGCVSAWSGTGGPILLLPILLFARVAAPLAVLAGQGVQLPIAGATTAVNLWSGQLNLMLGLALGALILGGYLAGWLLSRRLPVALLRPLLAWGLIIVGLWYGWRTFKDAFA